MGDFFERTVALDNGAFAREIVDMTESEYHAAGTFEECTGDSVQSHYLADGHDSDPTKDYRVGRR